MGALLCSGCSSQVVLTYWICCRVRALRRKRGSRPQDRLPRALTTALTWLTSSSPPNHPAAAACLGKASRPLARTLPAHRSPLPPSPLPLLSSPLKHRHRDKQHVAGLIELEQAGSTSLLLQELVGCRGWSKELAVDFV